LLRHKQFQWHTQAQAAFDDLKIAMSQTPVLTLPNFQEPFTVETDACADGIGAVLMQKGSQLLFLARPWVKSTKISLYMRKNSWH
jgi:hypothetical protein